MKGNLKRRRRKSYDDDDDGDGDGSNYQQVAGFFFSLYLFMNFYSLEKFQGTQCDTRGTNGRSKRKTTFFFLLLLIKRIKCNKKTEGGGEHQGKKNNDWRLFALAIVHRSRC